jgi:hypothetical protein
VVAGESGYFDVFERFAKGRAISDRHRHLLDEYFLAPGPSERVLLQSQVLVERRNSGVTDLVPAPVNFAVPSGPYARRGDSLIVWKLDRKERKLLRSEKPRYHAASIKSS